MFLLHMVKEGEPAVKRSLTSTQCRRVVMWSEERIKRIPFCNSIVFLWKKVEGTEDNRWIWMGGRLPMSLLDVVVGSEKKLYSIIGCRRYLLTSTLQAVFQILRTILKIYMFLNHLKRKPWWNQKFLLNY